MTQGSKLYGIYIHNLTTMSDREIALESVDRLLREVPPLRYEYGDVLALEPDTVVTDMIREICEKNGFIVDTIAPNQLYRLIDSMVLHYVFVNTDNIELAKSDNVDKHIINWEISMGLTEADQRYTRIIKTFFMQM